MLRAVLCLPTYNERENLEHMIEALGGVLDTARDRVLVIDDGSPDGTGEIADRLAAALPWVSVLHRETKEGIGPAYVAGFRRALEEGAELILEALRLVPAQPARVGDDRRDTAGQLARPDPLVVRQAGQRVGGMIHECAHR